MAKNTEYALMAATNIVKHHSRHHKSLKAIDKFKAYLKKDMDSAKLSDKLKEELKAFEDNLLKDFEKATFTKAEAADVMEYAYELWKVEPKNNELKKLTINSLKKDKKAHIKVHLAMKIHARLENKSDDKKTSA